MSAVSAYSHSLSSTYFPLYLLSTNGYRYHQRSNSMTPLCKIDIQAIHLNLAVDEAFGIATRGDGI